jgi:uncharacterized protein YutE (UPF0331/DUF86 family)
MVAAVPTTTDELAELAELLRDGGGRFAFLHGSRVAGGSRTDSDLDVAVWFGRARDDLTLRARLPAGVELLALDEARSSWPDGWRCMAGCCSNSTRLSGSSGRPRPGRSTSTNCRASRVPGRTSLRPTAMVDAERLARLLRRTTDDLVRLRRWAGVPRSALLEDEVTLDHVEYRFVTAIEAVIDAAHHVAATEGFGTPATNAEAVLELTGHQVLPRELAELVARAVGFRNLLVHRYADVVDAKVVEQARASRHPRGFRPGVDGPVPVEGGRRLRNRRFRGPRWSTAAVLDLGGNQAAACSSHLACRRRRRHDRAMTRAATRAATTGTQMIANHTDSE